MFCNTTYRYGWPESAGNVIILTLAMGGSTTFVGGNMNVMQYCLEPRFSFLLRLTPFVLPPSCLPAPDRRGKGQQSKRRRSVSAAVVTSTVGDTRK